MKKLITSDITNSTGMPLKAGSLVHIQQAYAEAVAESIKGLVGTGYSSNVNYILNGCVNTGNGLFYNVSAGSIFRDGEVYLVDAASFSLVPGQAAIFQIDVTFATGQDADGVEFTDGVVRNVHVIRKAKLLAGAAGSQLGNYVDAQRIITNQPIVSLNQGTGIQITGSFPNFTISSTVNPGENPVLAFYNISLGDMNTDPEDAHTVRLSGGGNGQAFFLHTFPAGFSTDNISIWLQVGNQDHTTSGQFATNYMCSALLGQKDRNKFYFSIQTTATTNVQQLQLNYLVIKNP